MAAMRDAKVETLLEETLYEQREIIFATIHPILDALKKVFEANNTEKDKDLDIMREAIRAHECRIKGLESQIEQTGDEEALKFCIKDLESRIGKMRDDATFDIRTLQHSMQGER